MTTALITGVTGQDGAYLTELLLNKGYTVHGLIRRASTFNTIRIDHLFQDPHIPNAKLFLHYGDLSDSSSLSNIVNKIEPDEIYHLGAQSHVRVSFDIPEYTGDITGLGTARILEAIRRAKKNIKFYQASSSEMFGKVQTIPQNENTPFCPQSPYGCAKVYGYFLTINYRKSYGIFASNGILFNHESPLRGETFVTRKITRGIARILSKKEKFIFLGNLSAKRDWGYAKEYVDAMHKILKYKKPEDFVIATGETHSVREFVNEAFKIVDLDPKKHIRIDKRYFRPSEVDLLIGDASKAKRLLGWEPKVKFKELVKIMVVADLRKEGVDHPVLH